jgi:membrane protease YdiL (CAAX protease family)
VLAVLTRLIETPDHVEEFFTRLLTAGSPAELAVVLLAAAVVPAVTEEVLFRGFLQGALERRLGRWPAVLVAAAAFGLIHGAGRAPVAFTMGLLLGWTAARTGSVLPAIAAHASVNAIAVTLVNSPGFGTGRGWPETLPWPALLLWAAASAGALATLRRRTPGPPDAGPAGSDRTPPPEAGPPRPPS